MIRIENISKKFRLYHKPSDRLREIIFRKTLHRDLAALQNISFNLSEGETLGIIGQNGAGKSTLLKILTGVLLPDSGGIFVDGKITGLLELGTGFNPEFSGVDNIYLNGSLLDMSKPDIEKNFSAIADFAELGEFIYEPIKTYSSGMMMRLAFSIAIHAEPKCFVVDEALSVGDAYFQQKCIERIKTFKKSGGAIIFVSHDMNAVKILCDRAILMKDGTIVEDSNPEHVINVYNFLVAKMSQGEKLLLSKNEKSEYGNYKVVISKVALLNEHGDKAKSVTSGRAASVKIYLQARQAVPNFSVGILFRDKFGQDIFGTNTHHLKKSLSLKAGEECMVEYLFDKFDIGVGKYTLTVAVHTDDTHLNDCYHWVDTTLDFEVVQENGFVFIGIVRLEPTITVN